MDIIEKYYELQELKEDIDSICWKLEDNKELKNYQDALYETMIEVEKEIEEIEPEVQKIEDEENRQRENEYIEAQLGGYC